MLGISTDRKNAPSGALTDPEVLVTARVRFVTAEDNCATAVTDAGPRVAPGDSAECRLVREFLSQLGDKWTLLVILALSSAPMRFNALQRAVVGISHRMLTVTLRKLERDGLVHRTHHPGLSPHIEYALTPLGVSFIEPVMAVANWAIGAQPQIERNREQFDR